VSVRSVLDSIARVTGHDVPHSVGPRRPGDPAALVADASATAAALGWTPALSDIDTIIATAWRWHQRAR